MSPDEEPPTARRRGAPPSADHVQVTATPRDEGPGPGTPTMRGPISVSRRTMTDLVGASYTITGSGAAPNLSDPLEPAPLLEALRTALGRAQGRSPLDQVALLRLVLVADAFGMVLRCR